MPVKQTIKQARHHANQRDRGDGVARSVRGLPPKLPRGDGGVLFSAGTTGDFTSCVLLVLPDLLFPGRSSFRLHNVTQQHAPQLQTHLCCSNKLGFPRTYLFYTKYWYTSQPVGKATVFMIWLGDPGHSHNLSAYLVSIVRECRSLGYERELSLHQSLMARDACLWCFNVVPSCIKPY